MTLPKTKRSADIGENAPTGLLGHKMIEKVDKRQPDNIEQRQESKQVSALFFILKFNRAATY
ncbi:hypothetical protein WJR50_34030 [Catalinimonas sp. 4WD22]|uniref:hypothetical protein n=1 Tax=Catalinimonas locisalis TaxID=3133978 RepID=UPI00310164CD